MTSRTLAALTVIGILAGWISALHAHDSWINSTRLTDPVSGEWCCNMDDCRPEKVREVAGGYLTEAGDVVPPERVIWKTPDGQWWRCRNLNSNTTRCLIGPPPGS